MTLRDTNAALTVRRAGNRSPGGSGAAASPAITVDGAFFDGTNDLMLRGGGLTGAADGPLGLGSFWFRKNGGDGVSQALFRNATANVNFFLASTNKIGLIVNNPGATITFRFDSTATFLAGATWHHLLFSYQTNLGAGSKLFKVAIDGVADAGVLTDAGASFSVDNTDTDWAIGAATGGTVKLNADLAEIWWDETQFLDVTLAANIAKWRTLAGKPCDLAADGSLPTGTAPLSYHHLADGEAVANFALNRGTGGNYTITGALVTSATSPSD